MCNPIHNTTYYMTTNNCGIYIIKNIITNMVYIGSSKQISIRKNQHFSMLKNNKHYNKRLQNAWNKYGEENFIFNIVENVEETKELSNIEQKYLNIFESYKREKGYNICEIAESCLGRSHNEETKRKISLSKLGSKNGMYGKKVSTKTKEILSKLNTGENNHFYGKHHTDETKQRLSMLKKGKEVYVSAEQRELMISNSKNTKRNNSKLNLELVREIRTKYSQNIYTQKQLAEEYSLKEQHIYKIINNIIWKEND